jgi:hypothetical protein
VLSVGGDDASGGATRDNLSLVALAARRDPEEPSRVRVFARLISMRSQATPVTLVLTIDGQDLARRAVVVPGARLASATSAPPGLGVPTVDAGSPGRPSGDLEPGEHSVALEFVRPEGGVLRGAIERPDALDADNAAALVLPPVRRASILLVAPGEADFFLRNVLEELTATHLRIVDEATYLSPAGVELVDAADLVVFDRVRPDSLPDRPSLSFGAGVPVAGLDTALAGGQGAGGEPEARATGAAQWDRSHPTLADVTLDSLLVARPIWLAPDPRSGTRSDRGASSVRVLASGRDGPLIAEARGGARTRLVVAFALHDSNWPISVGFPIFLASAVDYLVYGGDPGRGVAFRAGEAIASSVIAGVMPGVTIAAVDDAGREAAIGTGSLVLERAGVYTLRGAGIAPGTRIAVNLGDEFESRLGSSDRVAIAGELVAGTTGAPRPQELWFWFVLAAGLVLVVEWVVYLAVARA